VPLRVDIVVPSSSAARVQMAEILQEQWRSLGVELRIDPAEPAALGARMERRDFTMALATIHTSATPAGLRQSWGEAGTGPKGRNVGRYRSATFEAHVDSAFTARSAAEARDQFAKAYRVLLADAPAVFLYQSKTVVALNRRVHTTSVRGDAWWFDLSAWGLHPSTAAR
jgi:peptide/nickel transport system substrate-binding protein